MKKHLVLLAGLLITGLSGARLIAQAPPETPANNGDGPDEAGKEFVAYLARQDFESLKNLVARDSFLKLGEAGVEALLRDLRLVPDRYTASNGESGEVLVTPGYAPKPVICKKEGKFWRVDAVATGARWRGLDAASGPARIVRAYSVLPQLGEDSRATCLTNLQSIAVALRQYQEDYKDAYPPAAQWNASLTPYLRGEKALHCPAAGKQSYGYALNAKMTKNPPAAVPLAVIYETGKPQRNASSDGRDLIYRHEDRTQVLLSDGTARTFPKPRRPFFQVPLTKP